MASRNIYRAVGRSEFGDAVSSTICSQKVLEGLKTLGLVGHQKGQSRYRKTPFGNRPFPAKPRASGPQASC